MQSAGAVAAAMGAGRYATPLAIACTEFGIDTDLELAHFLAQLSHESSNFTASVESLNYSVAGLKATFSRSRISEEDCERYGRKAGQKANQVMIATKVYGGAWGKQHLGNVFQGDGWKFRGRSLIQTTGRFNYRATSLGIYGDERLLTDPTPLENDATAMARAACWYWKNRKCKGPALRDDIDAVTELVNGKAKHGLAERKAQLKRAKKILEIP